MSKNKNNLTSMLKSANYLLIDNLDALALCKKNGLNKSTKIISFNPYLVLGLNTKIVSPEQDISAKYYNDLSMITKDFTGKIYNKVYSFSKDNSLAIYIAHYVIHIQNLIHKTSLITHLVKDSNLVVIYPDYSKKSLNNSINGKFYNILENQKNIKIYKLSYKGQDQTRMGRDPISNFWVRFNFEGINSLLFRLFVIFCAKFNFLWKGKRILFSHENTLLKGTASYLFRKGFFIEKLSANLANNNLYKSKILDDITNIINPLMTEFKEKIISEEITIKNELFFKMQLKKYISDYFKYKNFWEKYFIDTKNKNIFACLIGTPGGPKELSCIEVAKKSGILTASFQHGISKEISADLISIDALYESNLVDHYFVYNNKAADNSKKSRFNISRESIVGLAEDMKKGLKKNKNVYKAHPVLYASTTLYCGNRGIPSRSGSSDLSKANFELNIIKNILSKIPHKVHYKPYYSKRYSGPSIELEQAKHKDNIYINNDEVDLRYIIGNFRIIVTSRATSTIGWCYLSGKPVIYIENEDNRLTKEASSDFKKNLFYFDVLEKNWDTDLHNFLSQPIEIIEKEWKKKVLFKHEFIKNYFGSEDTNAEKKCANILLKDFSNIYNNKQNIKLKNNK